MKKKRLFLCILIVTVMILYDTRAYKQWKEAHSKIPDAINTMSTGNDLYLTVIANARQIEDKEEFARTVVHMCQNNSFHSVRFSTDCGYPSGLNITVYLNRKDIEARKEPVCKILFKTDDFSKDYNIKDNPDEFHLYLDGEEIIF